MMGKRLHLWRLSNFKIERLPSVADVYLLHAVARDNPKDERLFAAAEVRDVTPVRDEAGRIVQLPHLERMLMEALAAIRLFQSRRRPQDRLYWNRVFLYVWPPLNLKPDELTDIVRRLAPETEGLGLEQVVVRARIPNPATGELRDMVVRISSPVGSGLLITFRPADKLLPLKPLTAYDQKVIRVRQRGMVYPYEIIKMLTPTREDTRSEFPPGDFVEHDLDAEGRLVPVDRPYGQNKANIIVGVIRNFTNRYPEGMTRVLLLGDPSRDLGALAEAECRLIIGALDLAEEKGVPVEWFPISAGAKISMDSGVENMDWIAQVLRRLVEFTQAGGEVNLLINGINVGAQPYWNAEATMLMHTRGILVMTPKAAMVLTGKRALDYSGGISAEDNQGIGGYDRIMGVNGQAQYWARDINEACHILFRHYEHTYVLPGERFPRRAETTDPIDRDVQSYPHNENGEEGFARVGEILSDETNPGRKKPFDIRRVMMATIDQDHAPLERWAGMRAAETAVVWDAHLGGYPVCLIGIESRSVPRMGFVPADGPDQWSAGTLFPQSSKKVARAINAASDNRPVVVLANLSGFDGSPESMRRLQLEYGAEIGRAVVNFKGPIVFCVISRYHGGAYVVFSRALNEQLEVAALEGTYASVIGGAPAAAVVFAGEVEARTRKDERLQALNQAMLQADGAEKGRLRAQWNELFKVVYSEKLGEMAGEFDRIHSVHRALSVGALDHIIPPANLRPYLVHAVERGMRSEEKREWEGGTEGRGSGLVARECRRRVFRGEDMTSLFARLESIPAMDVYWLEQTEADVPAENQWLSAREMCSLHCMRFAKRRNDWRLGRWTAKRALAACLNLPSDPSALANIEIRAAPSGAPEVYLLNQKSSVTISLSHRSGTALCAVALSGTSIGCDLEMIEARSKAFTADYFTVNEQSLVEQTPAEEQPLLVTLLWSAKESALKALHMGLRLDTTCLDVKFVDELLSPDGAGSTGSTSRSKAR